MRKLFLFVSVFFCILFFTAHANGPEFMGTWFYSDPSMAAENSYVYEITDEYFFITASISKGEGMYVEALELGIIDYDEQKDYIKTMVTDTNGERDIFGVSQGDTLYWKYNIVENGICFDVSGNTYPKTASTGPFQYFEEGTVETWAEFAGSWYYSSEDGSASETFTFLSESDMSDFAICEVYAEYSRTSGYALFEIHSYEEESNHMQLQCIESNGCLAGFAKDSKWYLTYTINDGEAYFELSQEGYPSSPRYGPYYPAAM